MDRRSWGIALACAAVVAACDLLPIQPPAPGEATAVVTVEAAEEGVASQAIRHRWQRSDVYQYDVALRRWNGTAFVDLSPPLVVVLPQKGKTACHALFSNLRQGQRYLAAVTARGNVGGTAPDRILNAGRPCEEVLDFQAVQDVEASMSRQVTVILDPVPFSGTLTIVPWNLPASASTLDVQLRDEDSGLVRFAASYARDRSMLIHDARTGLRYRVYLTARTPEGVNVAEASSDVIFFDPVGQDLEQDVIVPVTF